ncbi:hypothetical protein DPMN_031779 [Dreissena polymorpha]|uniref:Uncharacterized protein n=1 Tax=Dreissena polymorpha TaxID=45954 RepID=A0A9D4M1N8_DREPO|nr:hypothetical protein DPMN_031779 [Dreissena polymorpha]
MQKSDKKRVPDRKAKDIKNLKLKGIDKDLAEKIINEIIDSGPQVTSQDIVGQEKAKTALHEIVVLPALNPQKPFFRPKSSCPGVVVVVWTPRKRQNYAGKGYYKRVQCHVLQHQCLKFDLQVVW